MTCKMNTKIMAALAVFAMMFAGFGAVFIAQADDAEDASEEPALVDVLVINIAGVVDDEDLIALIDAGAGWTMKYTVTLDDDIDEKITVITKDYYDAMKDKFGPFKGGVVIFTPADLNDPAMSDAVEGLKLFTSLEMNKRGEIVGGVDTAIIFQAEALPAGQAKAITLDFVFEEDAEAAVIAAVLLVEAQYADYYSPEEVAEIIEEIKGELYTKEELDTAVAKAIADTKALYKDYKSPAEVKEACDKAVEDYKAAHPVKDNSLYLYLFIVALAVVLALAGFMVFDKVIKPKMAKKDEIQVI